MLTVWSGGSVLESQQQKHRNGKDNPACLLPMPLHWPKMSRSWRAKIVQWLASLAQSWTVKIRIEGIDKENGNKKYYRGWGGVLRSIKVVCTAIIVYSKPGSLNNKIFFIVLEVNSTIRMPTGSGPVRVFFLGLDVAFFIHPHTDGTLFPANPLIPSTVFHSQSTYQPKTSPQMLFLCGLQFPCRKVLRI